MTPEYFRYRKRKRNLEEIFLQRQRMIALFNGEVSDDEKQAIMGKIRSTDFTIFREYFLTFTYLFGIGIRNSNREAHFDRLEVELRSGGVAVGCVPSHDAPGGHTRFILESDFDKLTKVFPGYSTNPS